MTVRSWVAAARVYLLREVRPGTHRGATWGVWRCAAGDASRRDLGRVAMRGRGRIAARQKGVFDGEVCQCATVRVCSLRFWGNNIGGVGGRWMGQVARAVGEGWLVA